MIVRHIYPKKWWKRATWELMEDYTSPQGYKVPKGYISDGASIPRSLIMFGTPTGLAFKAAVVHDYLIDSNHDRDDADKIFLQELRIAGMSWVRRHCMYIAVRIFTYYERFFG